MAEPPARIDIQPIRTEGETSRKIPLLKTPDTETIQFIIPAGEGIPVYEAQGALILHCLEGRVLICVLGEDDYELRAGQLLYISRNESFSIRGVEDASLLATIIAAKQGRIVELIGD